VSSHEKLTRRVNSEIHTLFPDNRGFILVAKDGVVRVSIHKLDGTVQKCVARMIDDHYSMEFSL
jgi:hypothetical protein